MTKKEYMQYSIKNNLYLQRSWLLSVFGILIDSIDTANSDSSITFINNKVFVKIDDTTNEITDYVPGKPLYERNEKLELNSNDLKSIKEPLTTTYGILIINALLIEYPYEGIVDYINREITGKLINNVALQALVSNKVTMTMHLKFENAVSAMSILAHVGVPAASRKAITINPEVIKQKPLLLKEYKDRMDDPASVAELQAKLVALDVEYIKGDPAERFILSEKTRQSRLRTMTMIGAEQDFIDESKINVLEASLAEGWEVKDIPVIANTIRGGSYNRGVNTALGGTEVKISARSFQNYKVVRADCQTTNGLLAKINSDNYKQFIGRYPINKDKPLLEEDLVKLIDKTVVLRSPTYCVSEGTTMCYKCVGDTIANSGVGINGLIITLTSSFLNLFMALMHTQRLSSHRYNYLNRIT
jgi:hypothetical protein